MIACVVILAVIPHNAGPDARTPKGVVTQGGPQVRTGGAGTPSVAPRPAADAASSPVPAAGKARVVTASADHTAPTPVSAVTGSPVQAPPPVAKPPIAVAHAAVAMIPPSVPSKATSVAAVVELQSRTKPVPASAATGPSKQTSPTPINSQSPTPGSSSLLPVPAESVREAANKLAQDVYRSEYDGAKTSTAQDPWPSGFWTMLAKVRAVQPNVMYFFAWPGMWRWRGKMRTWRWKPLTNYRGLLPSMPGG